MHTIKLLSAKGLPVSGESKGVRERKPGEAIHYWKDKEADQNYGTCHHCQQALGTLMGVPFFETEDRWADSPSKCGAR